MSQIELSAIIDKGFEKVEMSISPVAKGEIIKLSQGLPHFTHLMSLESAFCALHRGSEEVQVSDVHQATKNAVRKSHTLLSDYVKATECGHPNNLYKEVLYSCARADKDDLGWFSSSDVAPTLSELMGREISVPYFARHLNEFTQDKRGPVLKKGGTARRHKYKFRNPLIEPFIIISALSTGLIPPGNI